MLLKHVALNKTKQKERKKRKRTADFIKIANIQILSLEQEEVWFQDHGAMVWVNQKSVREALGVSAPVGKKPSFMSLLGYCLSYHSAED